MKKKSAFIVIIMAITMIIVGTAVVNADTVASGTAGDNITWSIDSEGVLSFDGIGEMYPAMSGGWKTYPFTKVIVGNGITSIGAGAFECNTSISSVSLPNSIETVGKQAFAGCNNLSDISLPNNLKVIEQQAFESVDFNGPVYLPNGLTTIGESAFTYSSLTEVNIPDTVTTLGKDSFSGCGSLCKVRLPNGITTISDGAFGYCGKLTSIEMPDSITNIGYSAFMQCRALNNIKLSKNTTHIERWAFHGSAISSIDLPEGITTIDAMAFGYCENLKSVTIPMSVTSLEGGSFGYYDDELKIPHFTIYGYTNSVAEKYANNSGFEFVSIGTYYIDITQEDKYLTKLSYSKTYYKDKACAPTVSIEDRTSRHHYPKTYLSEGTDYSVAYENNVNVGTASVIITGIGKYAGTIVKNFEITYGSKATSISKLTSAKKGFTVKWKKVNGSGYQIRYSTNSSMKSAKKITVGKANTTSKKISNLSSKKKYYIQVRSYKNISGEKCYSAWSKTLTIKTK